MKSADLRRRRFLTAGAAIVGDVEFAERGEIVRISALRSFAGKEKLIPWVGRFSDYRRIDGMMVPTSAEVEWELPEGPFPDWRGRIVDTQYTFAP